MNHEQCNLNRQVRPGARKPLTDRGNCLDATESTRTVDAEETSHHRRRQVIPQNRRPPRA
jgi:hypothetical protein